MAAALRIGIIGGTGLGEALLGGVDVSGRESHDVETPFGKPSSTVTAGEYGRTPIAILMRHGDGHLLNPTSVPYRANIHALKSLGCTHIVAFGATGSLREDIVPGDLVICDQLIDRTSLRERTFFERVAVHVEFSEPFCPVMRRWLVETASRLERVTFHERGTYVCIEGPSFGTRAESGLHRQWGADVVGMTALPEARLAREAEIAYALVALATDYDCWRPREEAIDASSLLSEIMGNLEKATEASMRLLEAALGDVGTLSAEPSPAHDALRLAIWSDKGKVDPAEVDRLRELWGRHFKKS